MARFTVDYDRLTVYTIDGDRPGVTALTRV